MTAWIWTAFGLDLVLGDPRWLPHPVVAIGRVITAGETWLVGWLGADRRTGLLLVALTLGATAAVGGLLLVAGRVLHPLLYGGIWIWLAFSCLALRCLHRESLRVVELVEEGRIEEARRALGLLVSRETGELDREGILRATVETVAENTSDGVVAPLLYLLLGGPLLALLYKAVNTLDSMVGYRTERYRELGWAAARLDDLANWLPARLCAGLMVVSAWLLRLDAKGAWRMVRRDARKPESPNAGYPEAAAAGALGVRLGGPALYFGRRLAKPTLGDPLRPLEPSSYHGMVRLMYLTAFLLLLAGTGLRVTLG